MTTLVIIIGHVVWASGVEIADTSCTKITHKQNNESLEDFTKRLFAGYLAHHRPPHCTNHHDTATAVKVNLFVNSFGSINVVDMDYSVDFFLRQRWNDSRLRFSGYNETLSLNYMKEKLWIPDLFFRNSKEGTLHTVTTPNHLLWLQPSGEILFSQKLSVKLDCPMLLWNFPMDSQYCRLEMGSYGYALSDLRLTWLNHDQVAINEKMEISEFHQPIGTPKDCNKVYKSTGSFTCIYVQFHLVRKFGFYLIYTYLPSILVVMISWVSFWIDYHAVPARISIGLLSVLALITQSAATLQKLPRVSYIKAIDVWLFACLAFVVFSLLEFALVNVLARHQARTDWRNELRRTLREELCTLERLAAVNGKNMGGLEGASSLLGPNTSLPPRTRAQRRRNMRDRVKAQRVRPNFNFCVPFCLHNLQRALLDLLPTPFDSISRPRFSLICALCCHRPWQHTCFSLTLPRQ